jgi:hypothetical protein
MIRKSMPSGLTRGLQTFPDNIMRHIKMLGNLGDSSSNKQALEQFQAKWKPVRRPEMRQNNEIEQLHVST